MSWLCLGLPEKQRAMSGDNLCCQHLQNWARTEGEIRPWAQLVVWGNHDSVCVFDWGGALFKPVSGNPFSPGTETSLVNKLEQMWGNHSRGEVQAWTSPMRSVPTKAASKIYIRLFALWLRMDTNPKNTAQKPPPPVGLLAVGWGEGQECSMEKNWTGLMDSP